MKGLVLSVAILLGLAAPAWAGLAEGVAAYQRGDYAAALREFRPLAEQGDAGAQTSLGIMYFIGEGMPRDLTRAYMWYDPASSRFPPGAARDDAVRNRDFVAKHMTPARIAEARRLAREWKPKKEGK